MKKYIITYILVLTSMVCSAQAIHIFHDGNTTPDVVPNVSIDSIYFEPKFVGSTEYQQVFVTEEGVKRYNEVDSIVFNLPHLKASRHTYYVPIDYGCLPIKVSSLGGDNPVLLLADGKVENCSYGCAGTYIYDHWVWGDSNKRTETWYISNGIMTDSVVVHFTALPFAQNAYREIWFSADENEYVIKTNLPDSKLNIEVEGVDWYYNEKGYPVVHLSKNETGEKKHINLGLSSSGFVLDNQSHVFYQMGEPFMHTAEEHMSALREFCDSTDFANWGKNTNWWSDAPLWEWDFCVNNKGSSYFWHINDHVVNLIFGGGQYTGVRGTLPASFEVFMDDLQGELDLTQCALYGKIPYNIRHHKDWHKHGWMFIQQMPWAGGGFDMEDINLSIDDVEVEDFVNEVASTTYEVLKKNKITWVFNAGAVDMIDGISDGRVNKYLDYCDKGLGVVVTVGGFWDVPYDNYRNYVLGQQKTNNLPKSIVWTKGFDKADIGSYGSMSVLDSEGNLLWYKQRDYDIDDAVYVNAVDSVCRKYLGEPSEHEDYVSTHYRSEDYTHDGEVMTLQKATIGRGVDVVFLGDQYVDTLLVDGGQFEKDMYAAMEYLFSVEPYTTLRNRFNVYAVKAVSPNGYEGIEHKYNYNNDVVFEYAQKVPDVDMESVSITVLNYNPNFSFFVSGYTEMWESGTSIAYIQEGGPSDIIRHETGGHGIAKLLDEYVYFGYEDNHIQEGAEESFLEWIKTDYHDKGWGMNISATDNSDDVPWSKFLKDERYKDEVGIYKGAWLWPEELWRPSENSVMNTDYSWFNAPSREAIYKAVMQISEGNEWTYDYETFVQFDTPMREAYKQKKANARINADKKQNDQRRKVESRSPMLHKGSWREGKEVVNTQTMNDVLFINNSTKKVTKKDGHLSKKPYVLYRGQRVDAEKVDGDLKKKILAK